MTDPADSASTSEDTGATFAELARVLYARDEGIYAAICRAAPHLVSGCDHAALMMKRGKSFVTLAASDETAATIDQMKLDLDEGPCFDAIDDESVQVENDLATSSQWPALSRRIVAETDVRAMASFRFVVDGQKVGALNVLSDRVGAFTATSSDQAGILAAFAAVSVSNMELQNAAETMIEGFASNREINKAVGLLMAFHGIDDQAAFEILSRTSQDMNMRLSQVAHQVVEHHNEGQGGGEGSD